MDGKTKSIKTAVAINAASRYLYIVLAVVVNAILARLISPEDYGVMAILSVFSVLFTTMSDVGLSTAIVQNKNLVKGEIDDIFSFSFYVSCLLTILFALVSHLIANFYNNANMVFLCQLLSLSLFFNSLSAVPNGLLNKDKRFLAVSCRNVIVFVFAAVIAIVVAICGGGIYALIVQALVSSFFSFIWSYILTKPILRLKFQIKSIKKIAKYSGYQYGFSLINYFSRNLDNLLIGKYIGSVALAYYNKAYTLMLYPINNITGVITPVLHPILSDHQDNKKYIYEHYIKLLKPIALISVYVEVFCFFASEEIIYIMYGNNWGKAATCLKILSIAIMTQMITVTTGAIFQSLGETRLLFIAGGINVALTVCGIIIGVFWGKSIEVVSMFVVVTYILHFFVSFFIMIHYGFEMSFVGFLLKFWKEAMILVGLFFAGELYGVSFDSKVLSAVFKAVYLFVIYLIFIIASKEYMAFNGILKKKSYDKRMKNEHS